MSNEANIIKITVSNIVDFEFLQEFFKDDNAISWAMKHHHKMDDNYDIYIMGYAPVANLVDAVTNIIGIAHIRYFQDNNHRDTSIKAIRATYEYRAHDLFKSYDIKDVNVRERNLNAAIVRLRITNTEVPVEALAEMFNNSGEKIPAEELLDIEDDELYKITDGHVNITEVVPDYTSAIINADVTLETYLTKDQLSVQDREVVNELILIAHENEPK